MSEEKKEISYYEWLQEWEDLYFECPRTAFKCLVEDLWQAKERVKELSKYLNNKKEQR